MKKLQIYLSVLFFCPYFITAKGQESPVSNSEMIFVSDTQQPMWFEKILLKPNHNLKATADIFAEILNRKPKDLYMLGDVVCLGFRNKRWKNVDLFLDSCGRAGTNTFGILGNHELMGRRKKGEMNFAKRFPRSVRTGYVSIADSVAVVLLNSNFNSLTPSDLERQQSWYQDELDSLDKMDAVRAVIVTCHHAPFSNSKTVKSSDKVQQYFVPGYIKSKKARLFITGHAHLFEHFVQQGKDFLVIGGGGGLHQHLNSSAGCIADLASDYKPMFHYLTVTRQGDAMMATSHFLKEDFSGFENGHSFVTKPVSKDLPLLNRQ